MLIFHLEVCLIFFRKVGNGKSHSVWDRPESITTKQPAYKVDDTKPGSDVAGEYAAAMAAGYLAFKEKGNLDNNSDIVLLFYIIWMLYYMKLTLL